MADTDTLSPPGTKPETKTPEVKAPDKPSPREAAPVDYDRLHQALGLGPMQRTLAEDRAKVEALTPGPPKLTPPPVVPPPSDPFQAFGQPAMWLAAFGSLLTRHHLTSAIQSAGAVLDSVHKQDDEAVKRAMADWKVNSENAQKMAAYELNAYKAALSKQSNDIRGAEAEVNTLNHAFQNTAFIEAYNHGGLTEVAKLIKANSSQATLAAERKLKLDQDLDKRAAELKLRNAWKKAYPNATEQQTASAELMISQGKDPTELMTKDFTLPQELEITNEDGTKKKVLAQMDRRTSEWVMADKHRTPIEGDAGTFRIVKEGTEKAPSAAAAVEKDAETVAAANLARKAQEAGTALTPEQDKALADEPAARARVAARGEAAGIKTADTTMAREVNRKAAPGTPARERSDRFEELKRAAEATDTYKDDSAIWDKVDQQMIAIRENHISPAAARMIAEQAIAGDYSGLIGWGRSPGIRKDLENALTEEAASRNLTGQDLARIKANYAAYTQGVKAFQAGGQMEKPTRALSVAVDHLDLLKQTAQALAQNNVRALNALQNTLEREFGMSGPPTFDAIKGIVSAEIEKAVTGGAGAVADREDLKASLSKSLAPQALSDVIAGYEGLMGGQLNGIRATYQRLQRIEGQTGDDFDKEYLTPRAREILTKGAAHTAAPSAGGAPPAAALAHLKENEPTTFRNGQTWMLKDGQPVQVK